jgi:tetratricopeptide (TPR) repeat protein
VRGRGVGLLLAAVLSLGSVATPVHAESVWARAASKRVAREARAIRRADLALAEEISLSRMPATFRRSLVLKRALRALERVRADRSENPILRERLAQIHYRLFEVEREEEYLEGAIANFEAVAAADKAPVTMRAAALASLAICYARLDKHDAEIEVYERGIALQPDPAAHAILLANQAEGYMARGDIIPAVRGYRASLDATPSALMIDSGVTTMWGLAVALDRSGDLDGGIEQVRRARSYDPNDQRIHGSSWFYVPAYDEDWYTALGHWQIARDAKDADVSVLAYRAALASWGSFLERARPDDPWLLIAEHRRHRCEVEALGAETAAGRKDRTAPPEDPEDQPLWP